MSIFINLSPEEHSEKAILARTLSTLKAFYVLTPFLDFYCSKKSSDSLKSLMKLVDFNYCRRPLPLTIELWCKSILTVIEDFDAKKIIAEGINGIQAFHSMVFFLKEHARVWQAADILTLLDQLQIDTGGGTSSDPEIALHWAICWETGVAFQNHERKI